MVVMKVRRSATFVIVMVGNKGAGDLERHVRSEKHREAIRSSSSSFYSSNMPLQQVLERGIRITSLVYSHSEGNEVVTNMRILSGRGTYCLVVFEGTVNELLEMWTKMEEDIVWGSHWILFANSARRNVRENLVSARHGALPKWIEVMKRKSPNKNFKCYDIFILSSEQKKDISGIYSTVFERRRMGDSFRGALRARTMMTLLGRTITLATNEFEPFVSMKMDENQTLQLTGGMDVKLVLALQEKFRFRLKVVKPNDGEWGLPERGNWSGLIGAVQKQEADIAVCCLSITASRSEVVDFSVSYHKEDFVLIVKKPKPKSKMFALIMPFTIEVWILIMATLLVGTGVLYTLGKVHYKLNPKNKPSFQRIVWFLFGTTVNQSCCMSTFKGRYSLAFLGAWFWFALVICVSYTAPLTSFMTFPLYEPAINTFQDLASVMRSSRSYGCGAIKGSNNYEVLLDFEGPLKIISDRVRVDKRSAVKTTKEGLYRVAHEDFAVVLPKSSSRFEASVRGLKNVRLTREVVSGGPASVAMRKGFHSRLPFNTIIRRLVEMGFIQKWMRDEIFKARLNAVHLKISEKVHSGYLGRAKHRTGAKALALVDLKGVFVLLVCGYAGAFVICVFEHFRYKLQMAARYVK